MIYLIDYADRFAISAVLPSIAQEFALDDAQLGLVSGSLFLGLALLVKLTSPGPVLYRQARLGRDNRSFDMLKFRTMRVDAEQESGPVWTVENDPRRTPIGTFLRRFSLDELPQLINVLAGDMSLVGPRPPIPPVSRLMAVFLVASRGSRYSTALSATTPRRFCSRPYLPSRARMSVPSTRSGHSSPSRARPGFGRLQARGAPAD